MEEAIGWYQVFSDASTQEPMTPLSRLALAQRHTRDTGIGRGVRLVGQQGRPEALASIYPWEGNLVHDFASLSRGAKLVARDGGRVIWSPASPGVEFNDIPGAPAPAGTPTARLRQMKGLTDRFKVTMTGWKPDKSDREELRLLPKPLYHDDLSEGSESDPGWIDAGVFAFVQGTDPEAILLLEAVRHGKGPRWQYAFARATASGLEARLDKTVVWAVEFLEGRTTPLKPQMTLRRPLSTTTSGFAGSKNQ